MDQEPETVDLNGLYGEASRSLRVKLIWTAMSLYGHHIRQVTSLVDYNFEWLIGYQGQNKYGETVEGALSEAEIELATSQLTEAELELIAINSAMQGIQGATNSEI